MANDYSRMPQGSSGSGGLGGTGANTGAEQNGGQNGATWSAQPPYAQPSPSQQYPPYDQYDPQRAFAVMAAPLQNSPQDQAQNGSPSAYGASDDAANFATSANFASSAYASGIASGDGGGSQGADVIGRLVIRPLPSEVGGQTREVVLNGRDVAVGRSPACDIVLEGDQLVSRRHALLRFNGTQYTVVDLGSSNGTFVNEVEIHGTTPLSNGDLLTIGEHELLYSARPQSGGPSGGTQGVPATGWGASSGAMEPAGMERGGWSGGLSPAPASPGFSSTGYSAPGYTPSAYSSSAYSSSAYSSPGETAPQLAPGSLEASQLVESGAAQGLIDAAANPALNPLAQGRPEPAWTQPAQMFFAQQPPAESEMPAQSLQPFRPTPQPQAAQPTPPVASVPPTPYALPEQPYAPQPNPYPNQYPNQYPNPYEQPMESAQGQQPPSAFVYTGAPSNQPPSQISSQAANPQQATSSGGLAASPSTASAAASSSARNTTAYLRAVRAQLDEANQRLVQAEEEESRLAEQRRAALVEVRDRLNAILREQGIASAYGAGGYGQPVNANASPNANPNLGSLIALARQTAENPNHVTYMVQLAAHAGEIAQALESAQNAASGPSRSGNSGLLAQLDALRARLDQLTS